MISNAYVGAQFQLAISRGKAAKAKTHSASFKFSFHPKTSLRQSKIGYLCNVMSLSMLSSKKSFKES